MIHPATQSKLQAELDEALGPDDDPIAPWVAVKDLPYLDAVIDEGLRLFCAFSMGLPRAGRTFWESFSQRTQFRVYPSTLSIVIRIFGETTLRRFSRRGGSNWIRLGFRGRSTSFWMALGRSKFLIAHMHGSP